MDPTTMKLSSIYQWKCPRPVRHTMALDSSEPGVEQDE